MVARRSLLILSKVLHRRMKRVLETYHKVPPLPRPDAISALIMIGLKHDRLSPTITN